MTADVATPPPTPPPVKKPTSKARTSSSGSPSSSGFSSEGRFLPGTLLAGRYRIVAVLGKGGMGEVYRADDMTLAQPVALKFVPEAVDNDAEVLARFHNEIRVARRVSHPNVCRVYDVGQVEGHTFLSMEYVDGEDLASLLRRIGRVPGDKALEIARQLCAGLAAAHQEGVLHRDLKPANVMLDGRGRALLTDFGLASLADQITGYDVRSGTPAYMAPEQLAGREVTVQSDIYSLGLVLYEIFTGKRAFVAESLPELVKQRNQEPLKTPSSLVKDLDPAVERVIMRCLETEPAKRPTGALQVAAALPGGDPLAAALAAGETPSPQMVAAAGETTGLTPLMAALSLAAVILGLAATAIIGLKVSGLELMNNLLPPEVLEQKARETIDKLGYSSAAVDHAAAFDYDTQFTNYVHSHFKPHPDWPKVLSERPQVLDYYYRQSPSYLSQGSYNYFLRADVVSFDDPPPTQSGMINIILDAQGRLSYLQAIPKELDPNPPPAQAVDWNPLFVAAGLDPAQFHRTEPNWLSLAAFDERAAWTGSWPGSDFPLRVEAAAWRGKPVFFKMIGPWTKPDRTQVQKMTSAQRTSQIIQVVLAILLLTGGALVARRNYVKGKSDVLGAFRLASAAFVTDMVLWVCLEHFIPTLATFAGFLLAVSKSLFLAAVVWTLYVALEPYVRRHWPQAIISWSRLLAGRLRDPLVGRDLLWGVLLGVLWSLTVGVAFLLLKREGATPQLAQTELMMGSREMLGLWLDKLIQSIIGTLQFFFVLFLLRVILRNRWVALICFVGLFTALNTLRSDHPRIVAPFWVVVYGLAAGALTRFGLIVLATAIFTANVLLNLPYSLDFSRWYTPHVAVILIGFLAIAAWGFYSSLGGQKLLKDDLFE
jgi:serine/threonine-protein kinase